MRHLSRRDFLKLGAGTIAGITATALLSDLAFLEPVPDIQNPLAFYPNRDWEQAYRTLNKTDSQFTFLCAPNDTHNCLLKANVRQGVVTRIEPSYQYGRATDVYGNTASHRWDPRACQKGLSLMRRFYGDRRVKGPMIRKGFLDWVEAGFPRDPVTGQPPKQYFNRGKDEWLKLSWDQAFDVAAKTIDNITRTYSGSEGTERLRKQGYDEAMVDVVHGAGVLTLKLRGGMPFLGATRICGMYRFANMLALLDAKVRGVGPDQAVGARGWDSYSWHTDLPPGHPMVTGQQTVEFDLFTAENSSLITLWGMNWIATKMPDGHWLTEARLRGAKVVVIATEYQATANKADEVIVIRPGTDTALALGIASVIIDEKRYDEAYVQQSTDLPLLVRMDTSKLLRAADIVPDYKPASLENFAKVLAENEKPAANFAQNAQQIPEKLREEWGDYVVWDAKSGGPQVVTRDQVGQRFAGLGLAPQLEGTFSVTTVDGTQVTVRPVFDLIKEYLREFSPKTVSEITWAPAGAIVALARQIAQARGKTLLVHGMGPNHFFNADLKDRALFLVAALTGNIGSFGGTPGAYAGNYRTAIFNGLPQYIYEDPFDVELDPAKPARTKSYFKAESAHYYNYGDRPLRLGRKLFTGKSHIPSPTKLVWWSNSNSLLGNVKWAYDVIVNTLPKIEALFVNEWWWSMSCEYADLVFGVDSWAELKFPDMAGSVSNPFVSVFPRTPLPRLFDTRSDIETFSGVAEKLGQIAGDPRFTQYWQFVREGNVEAYLQRIVQNSNVLRGYQFASMEEKAKGGVPVLAMQRTYPRVVGWEQTQESRPWYTKTGRCEFYRDEPEFIEYGENLPVYREPVDATVYEPNAIVGQPNPVLKPTPPEAYGLAPDDLSVEVRQVRNIMRPWAEVRQTKHPRRKDGLTHIFITPKYRHGTHTTPTDLDNIAMFFGPFGDVNRLDKRKPYINEGYVDINPLDAIELRIEDGDYVWIDADPEDRPYRGWKAGDPDYKVARLMCRARYYAGTPRGVLRMWYNMYQASHGTVEAHETRPDGLAKNAKSGYQALFRFGGHQSTTRAWLRPTLMTDTLVRKDAYGQVIGKGFAADIHCANGAPKESFVKVSKAEDGGIDGNRLWRPAKLGFRPTYENAAMKQFLAGDFIAVR